MVVNRSRRVAIVSRAKRMSWFGSADETGVVATLTRELDDVRAHVIEEERLRTAAEQTTLKLQAGLADLQAQLQTKALELQVLAPHRHWVVCVRGTTEE